jgi:endonuclease IV
MKSSPIDQVYFKGELCAKLVFLHKKKYKKNKLVQQLREFATSFNEKIKKEKQKPVIGHRNVGGKTRELEEERDKAISDLLQDFDAKRIVIIQINNYLL